MNLNQKMNQLVNDLKPHKPLLSAEKRTWLWFVSHILWIAFGLWFIQPYRGSFGRDLLNIRFLIEWILFIISSISLTYVSFLSVVPGRVRKKELKWAYFPMILLTAVLIFGLVHPAVIHSNRLGVRGFCEFEIFVFAVVPNIHLIFLLSKGFISFNSKTFFMAGVSAGMIPSLLMHIACVYEPLHILCFHLTPVFVVGGLGVLIANKFVKMDNS